MTRIASVLLCVLLLGDSMACRGPSFWARRGTIDAVAFAPGAAIVAVGGRMVGTEEFDDHGDVLLYDSATGTLKDAIVLPHRVRLLDFDMKGEFLAVCTSVSQEGGDYRDGLALFRYPAGDKPHLALELPSVRPVLGTTFSPNSRYFALASGDGLSVWDTKTWAVAFALASDAGPVEFSADGRLLAIPRLTRNEIEVWDIERRERIAVIDGSPPILEAPSRCSWVFFSRQRRALVLWNITRRAEESLLEIPGSECAGVALSTKGTLAAIVGTRRAPGRPLQDARVCMWNLPGDGTRREMGGAIRRVSQIAFTDDGARLVIAGTLGLSAHGILLFDVSTGKLLKRLPPKKGRLAAVGERKLATYTNESIAVWNSECQSIELLWEDRWRRHRWSPLE